MTPSKLSQARILILAFAVAPIFPQQTNVNEQQLQDALSFYRNGGAVALRLMPPSGADTETMWTVLILRGKGSDKTSFALGEFVLSPEASIASASAASRVRNDPAALREFLRRYAAGIAKGEFDALLASVRPLKDRDELPVKVAALLTSQGLLDLVK